MLRGIRFLLGLYMWFMIIVFFKFMSDQDIMPMMMVVILELPAIWLYRKVGKMKKRKAYALPQKEYGLVMIIEEPDEESLAIREPLIERCWDTGKLMADYVFSSEEWNQQKKVIPLQQFPTYLLISEHPYSDHEECLQNPFLVTTQPAEILDFLFHH